MKPRISKATLGHRRKPNKRSAWKHLAWIRCLPCTVRSIICDGGIEAAHVRNGLPPDAKKGGIGLKPGDKWIVPLCHYHHFYEQHEMGELAFWALHGIDPVSLAERLWRISGDTDAGLRTVLRARRVEQVG